MILDREYWENYLHCDYDEEIKKAIALEPEDLMKNSSITRRALSIFLNSSETRGKLITVLIENREKLKEFLLLKDFSDKSFQEIVGKVAKGNLGKKEIRMITKTNQENVRSYNKYDKFASIITLYLKNPDYLHQVFLLKQVRRRSHQRFSIDLQNKEDLMSKLASTDEITSNLQSFDNNVGDSRRSRYLGWFESDEEYYAFFIREYRRTMIRGLDSAIFDTDCEWITVQIIDSLDQIRVSYQSKIQIELFVPIALGQINLETCTTEDMLQEYRVLNPVEYVKQFLDTSLQSTSCPLIEVKLEPAPIRGEPILTITDQEGKSLRNEFLWFRQKNADLLGIIESVKECKINFRKYKVRIRFYHDMEGIEIRYADNTFSLELTKEFEDFMLNKFKLKVIPGVKS